MSEKIQNRDIKFKEWLVMWLEMYKRYSLKPSTYERYRYAAAVFEDADFPLCELTVEYLQSKVNQMYLEGKSSSTIRQAVVCARLAIRKAVILGYVPQGYAAYCDLVEIPQRKPRKVTSLSPFEVRRILQRCQTWDGYGSLFRFLLCTGARVGEAIALKWSDIDFSNRSISIERTDYRGTLQNAKTDNSARIIPLGSDTAALLRGIECRSEWVFCKSNFQRVDYRGALRDWHKLLDDLELPRCGLHTLRHTYATQALRCGVNAVVLARLLGHSDSSFTLRRYCDANYDDMRSAIRKINF